MKLLPANKHPKFLLAAIVLSAAGLLTVSGLALNLLQNPLNSSSLSPKIPQNPLNSPNSSADSASTSPTSFAVYDQALAAMQAQLTAVASPVKLGKNGILTITDSGILKPTDHNQTQGGIGTDVSRIGKIWGTFMDLKDDVSINGKLDISGKLTANGVVTLGDNSGDTIEVGGRFTSNLVPSQNNAVDLGTTSLRWRTGYFVNSIIVGSATTTITGAGITTDQITSNSSALIRLVSTGTLQLDTSTNNTNILLLTGSGNVGIGSTTPAYTLDVSGTGHYTGAVTFDSSISVSDLSCSDCLDFDSFEDSLDMDADTLVNGDYSLVLRAGAGAVQNSTSGSNDLQLSAEDKLILAGASFDLSTSNGAVDIISNQRLDLSAGGTLTLDTSQNNTNINLRAGSGSINLSSGTTTISGNVNLNSGTLTLNGIAYTFPGTQTASGVLLTDGSGVLSWSTGLTGSSLADDTLDFVDLQDELDLDADTTVNGDYSLILRTGLGAIQNSASGSNDLQLSAEDKLILSAASFDLLTSGGAVDIISNQRLDLSAGGTLTLDSSQNNSHIVLTPGTGNVGIGSTAPVYKLDVNGTLRIASTARVEGTLTVTTGGASVTGDLTLDGDLDFTGAQNITTTADNLTLSPTGNLIIDTSGGTLSIRDAAIDLTNQPTTLSASSLSLRSTGTFIIDTSANNTNLRLQAGTGSVQVSGNQLYLTGNLVVTGTETFNGIAYTFPGADGSASNVLTTSGTGLLSWGTLGAASITADSLDFTEFQDSLDLDADTSINGPQSFIVRAGNGARQNATSGSNDLQLSAEDALIVDAGDLTFTASEDGSSVIALSAARGGISLSSSSANGSGNITLKSAGTLQLDTSANNTNILLRTGTGQFDLISNRSAINAISLAATNGGIDISTSGVGGVGELRLRSGGSLKIDTSGNNNNILVDSGTGDLLANVGTNTLSAVDDTVAAIGLSATRGGITLSSSSANGNGDIRILSGGTLRLSTSANNSNLLLQAGSGNINLSSTGTITLTGNTSLNNGTLRLNGLTYTFPGADSANGVLLSNGSGLLSWTTLGASSITADSLDFSEFKDEMTLDADTTVNGDQSLVIRTGLGSIQNSTSGSNDLQLSAEDKLILGAASFDLLTSSGGVDIISAARIDLSGRGTLTLDTSQSNSHIVLTPGTGNVGIGSTAPVYKLDVNGTLRTSSTARVEGALTVTTGGASVTGDLTLDGDLDFTGPQNITTTSDDLTLSPTGNLIIDTSGGTLSIRDAGIDLTNQPTTISGSTLTLRSTGTLILDTSANNTNLRLQAGSGNVSVSSNQLYLTGNLVVTGTETFNGVAYTFPGTQTASGVLLTDGSGILSWTTGLTGASLADDTLDFVDLQDELDLDADTGVNGDYSLIIRSGLGSIQNSTSGSNDLQLSAEDKLILGAASFDLLTSSGAVDIISGSYLDLSSKGTLTLDTSANNTNIIIDSGTGDLTAQIGSGNIVAEDDATSALIFRASAGGIQLSTQSSDNGNLTLYSAGTLTLDTSRNNTVIQLSAGTGNIQLSATQAQLTGNLVVTGTETFNGVTYTFPGADGSSGQALTTNSSGVLSWTTTAPADDSLDFAKFEDSLDMDADTLVNGDYSLVLRAGAAGLENSTSGSNDLQLAAEDKLIFDAASFTLTASSGPIDILSRGYLDLSSTGTLTLDTSQNNTNILLKAGSGSINLSSGTTTISGNLNLNSGTLTLNGVGYTFPGADAAVSGYVLSSNSAGILSWVANGGISADSLDFTDFKDVLTMDSDTAVNGDYSFILRAGLGAIQNSTSGSNDIQLAAEDRLDLYAGSYSLTTSGNSVDIYSGGRIDLSAKGTLTLDTSQNNSQILVRAGTGRIDLSGNTILVNAGTGTVTLSSSGGITIGGEGATTRVSGDLNFTGRLMEDGNEVLGNIIAAYNGSCPTGWSEYTAARGRTVVGTPSGGTNAGTVGTALTNLQDPTHTHSVDPASTTTDSQGAHTHTGPSHSHNQGGPAVEAGGNMAYQSAYGNGADLGDQTLTPFSTAAGINRHWYTPATSTSGTGATSSDGAHTHSVDIASTTSSATSSTMPYVQLTYCQKTAGADYAEWTSSREQYQPGTVVSADPQASEQIKITETSYDSTMLGIISTTPGWTVGQETPDSLQLALNGRVPVKIDPDSPPIKIGDFLTSSAKPGLAMKAAKMGYTVGKALEGWSCERSLPAEQGDSSSNQTDSCKDSILVFVNLGTYLGPLTTDGYIDTGQNFIAGDVKVDLKKTVYQQLMSELNLPSVPSNPSLPSSPSSPDTLPAEALAEEGVSASVSQVLGILTEKLDKLSSQVDELSASASASPSSLNLLPSSFSLSGSYLDSDLTVSGKTTLADTGIAGSLTVGLLTIDDLDASINSLGETLKIQNLALADVDFLGGKVILTKSGDLQINSGKIAGNSSFRDAVTLPAGQGRLRIDTSWDTPPVTVNMTPTWNTNVWVEDLSESGFTVSVSQPPAENSRLFWLAIW